MKAAVSWSGGKDSCAALMRVRADYDVVSMITMCDDEGTRSRSHGLRQEVLEAHAARLGVRRIVGRCTWSTYDAAFAGALEQAKEDGVTHVIFGDILFPEHREWAERMCEAAGLVAVEPLFGSSTGQLFADWVGSSSEALIVTARTECLDRDWMGRPLSAAMLPEFERRGIDPCGERGEYHTVVTNCPLFTTPLDLVHGDIVHRSDCWALDVTVASPGRSR
jgi:diphthine-ammonia ligase